MPLTKWTKTEYDQPVVEKYFRRVKDLLENPQNNDW